MLETRKYRISKVFFFWAHSLNHMFTNLYTRFDQFSGIQNILNFLFYSISGLRLRTTDGFRWRKPSTSSVYFKNLFYKNWVNPAHIMWGINWPKLVNPWIYVFTNTKYLQHNFSPLLTANWKSTLCLYHHFHLKFYHQYFVFWVVESKQNIQTMHFGLLIG